MGAAAAEFSRNACPARLARTGWPSAWSASGGVTVGGSAVEALAHLHEAPRQEVEWTELLLDREAQVERRDRRADRRGGALGRLGDARKEPGPGRGADRGGERAAQEGRAAERGGEWREVREIRRVRRRTVRDDGHGSSSAPGDPTFSGRARSTTVTCSPRQTPVNRKACVGGRRNPIAQGRLTAAAAGPCASWCWLGVWRMMRWFQALLPKEDKFFDLFTHHPSCCWPAPALRELLDGGEGVPRYCAEVPHEKEADKITREVLLAVRRTFITPFDRSDIQRPDHLDGRRHRPDAEDRQGDHAVRAARVPAATWSSWAT